MTALAAEPGTVPKWTLGWRLQRSLAHAGISASDMAQDLYVSRGTVSRWLNDHGDYPRDMYLRQWAMRTGVPYTWLCHGDLNPCDFGPAQMPRSGRSGFKMHSSPTVNRAA